MEHLRQSRPRLTGWWGSPRTCRISPSRFTTAIPHASEQSRGHVVRTTSSVTAEPMFSHEPPSPQERAVRQDHPVTIFLARPEEVGGGIRLAVKDLFDT